jgi:hypothetical protein
MPRVHKRVAAKDYPEQDIRKGEEYYTWKIKLARGGRVYRQKTPPKRSQLTNSTFLSTLYDIEDQLENFTTGRGQDLKAHLEDIAGQIRDMGQEAQNSFDNMPEGLQQGDTGQLLEKRAQNAEEWANELEALDVPDEDDDEWWHEPDEGEEPTETEGDHAGMVFDEQAFAQAQQDVLDEAVNANPNDWD